MQRGSTRVRSLGPFSISVAWVASVVVMFFSPIRLSCTNAWIRSKEAQLKPGAVRVGRVRLECLKPTLCCPSKNGKTRTGFVNRAEDCADHGINNTVMTSRPEWFSSVPGRHMCGGDQSRRDAGLLGLTPRPLGGHHGRSVPASGLLSARTVCHGLILA